jgi:hypothetical protein
MSLESWSTAASVGTFIVITATAIAALFQLHHMGAANKFVAIQSFMTSYEGPELRDAFHFVRTELGKRLEDPEFRAELRAGRIDRRKHPEVPVCNFFDQCGLYYREGAIERRSFMRVNAGIVASFWHLLEPAIALMADPKLGNVNFQQFEYLTIQARRWLEAHPAGDFPAQEPRLPLKDPWPSDTEPKAPP